MFSSLIVRATTVAVKRAPKSVVFAARKDSAQLTALRYSSSSNKDEIPETFFDEAHESEKEWLDIASALMTGGFNNLTDTKLKSLNWKELDQARHEFNPKVLPDKLSPEILAEIDRASEDESMLNSPMIQMVLDSVENTDLGDHYEDFQQPMMAPIESLNYNIPIMQTTTFSEPTLDKFVGPKDDLMFRTDQQGYMHCPGKRQRSGKAGILRCHKIDLDKLDQLDVVTLRTYLSDDAEILSRKLTGLCAKCQRKVAKTIKRSRNFGILPHLGEYEIQEVRPTHLGSFHDTVKIDKVKVSKTVL